MLRHAVRVVAAARHVPIATRASRRSLAVHSVCVPDLGKSISEATVVELSQPVGARVNVDDVVAVLETDKVTVEVYTEHAGVLTERGFPASKTRGLGVADLESRRFVVNEDDVVQVDSAICPKPAPPGRSSTQSHRWRR